MVEPQGKGISDHIRDKRCELARAQALLGLPRKLGIVHLGGQNITALVPDIVRGQFDAPGNQIAKAGYMGAALGGGNEIHVAFGDDLSLFRQPDNRPAHHFFLAFLLPDKRLLRDAFEFHQVFQQIVPQAIFKIPFLQIV